MYTETLTQRQAIANGIPPQNLQSARVSTSGVDMEQSRRALFTLYIGAVTTGSISAWLQESSDNFNSDIPANDAASSFNGAASGKSQTGMTTSSSIITFEVRAGQLTPGKRYVRLQIKETAGGSTPVCVTAVGDEGVHKPNNANNGTHVATNGAQNIVA